MKKPKFLVFAFLLVMCLHSASAAPSSDSIAIIDGRNLIAALMDVGEVPGSAVAVGINNRIVWQEGFGFSDLENKVPAKPVTRFRLGSVSKMITIAAAIRLVDRGLLDIDAPIEKYLPDLPEAYKKLTARQLAGHLAGVRHYKKEDFQYDAQHFNSVKESLKIFSGDPLVHDPGTKYLYSTFGFVLLSAVVEAAAGKDFLKLVNDEVFAPLGLKDSCADQFREIIPNKTRSYERSHGKIANAPYEDPSYKWGAAGFVMTASDLVRFGMAHFHPGYLKQPTLDAMFFSQRTSDGKETGVGLGWRIGKDWRGRKIYHHAGNISGGRAVLILYPDQNLTIALMTNVSSQPAFVESTAQMIADSFMSDTGTDPFPIPAGEYEMSGIDHEKPFTANLALERNHDGYGGHISGDFPLLNVAAKNAFPAKLQILGMRLQEKNPVLILISPFGILGMKLEPTERGWKYSVNEGPANFQGEMLHKD